jgi:hypothetical protein
MAGLDHYVLCNSTTYETVSKPSATLEVYTDFYATSPTNCVIIQLFTATAVENFMRLLSHYKFI